MFLNISPLVASVVNGLNASATGDVIFIGSEFENTIVGHFQCHLYQSFSVSARTHNYGAV